MIQLFRVFIPSSVIGLIFSEVVLILSCYTAATAWFIGEELQFYLFFEDGFLRLLLVTSSILIGLYFSDLYDNIRVRQKTLLVQQVCLVIGVAFLIQGCLAYVEADWRLPRWIMIAGSGLCLVLLPAWRILYQRLVFSVLGAERILFVGISPSVRQIVRRIKEHPELGFTCVGYLDLEEDGVNDSEIRSLGSIRKLREVVEVVKPDRIVVGMSERRQRLPVYELLNLNLSGIRVEETSSLYETAFNRVCLHDLRPSQLIFSGWGPRKRTLILQGTVSLAIAAVGILLTLPVMILVAIAVRLSSPGPVLFRQTRVGLNNRHFTVYKFRSMYANAEARTGAVWAQKDDPRITPVGRWLRLLRLDELPQLFNVLKGDMAIVGPRPERPEFVKTLAEQIPFYRQRFCVLPGITGWAQINYKYGNTLEDTVTKLEYDLYYIKHVSLALDFYIMFHTVKIMLLTRGAN